MATHNLHIKTLRCDNAIIQRLGTGGLYTGSGPNSLASLPEDSEFPYISPADKALISVFRRLCRSSLEDRQKYENNLAANSHECPHLSSVSSKRIRREYDGKPEDGLALLLDLMPLGGTAGSNVSNIGLVASGGIPSRSRIIRHRRDAYRHSAGHSGATRNVPRGRESRRDEEDLESNDTTTDDDFSAQVANRFILFGGLPIVISFLLLGTKNKPKFTEASEKNPSELIVTDSKTKRHCFDVLFRLCCLIPETSKLLIDYQELVAFSFHCLANSSLRESACKLVEILLMEKPETLNLCSIPMLKEVLGLLDGNKLSSLCRILSITMSDLDTLEHTKNLLAQNSEKKSNNDLMQTTREINQELIMSIPGLLKKILDLAVSEKYFPRYANSPTEIDNWMRFIDDNISNEIGDEVTRIRQNPLFASTSDQSWQQSEDQLTPFSFISQNLPVPSQSRNDSDFSVLGNHPNVATNMGDCLLTRIESLYVLSLLLIGKHRKKMQRELAELELIPKLSMVMDRFMWKSNSGRSRTWNLVGHFNGCECSPEVAVKIQFLRLLHSFCDQNPYKHLLLTPCELDELRRIKPPSSSNNPGNTFHPNSEDLTNERQNTSSDDQLGQSVLNTNHPSTQSDITLAGPSSQSDSRVLEQIPAISINLMCQGTQGLLTKIIDVLKKEPTQSTFRFWLCRAVESFLRGRISYADQIFLLRRGLLQHVTSSIINTETRTIQHEIIQSSFDLLGEMIKFNSDACQQLDTILNTEAKLKKTMLLINDNLIDSNMFIRYVTFFYNNFTIA